MRSLFFIALVLAFGIPLDSTCPEILRPLILVGISLGLSLGISYLIEWGMN